MNKVSNISPPAIVHLLLASIAIYLYFSCFWLKKVVALLKFTTGRQWDGAAGKGACCQDGDTWVWSLNPHGRRRLMTASCPSTVTRMLPHWHCGMCALVHVGSGACGLWCTCAMVHVGSGACGIWCTCAMVHAESGACGLWCMCAMAWMHTHRNTFCLKSNSFTS